MCKQSYLHSGHPGTKNVAREMKKVAVGTVLPGASRGFQNSLIRVSCGSVHAYMNMYKRHVIQ